MFNIKKLTNLIAPYIGISDKYLLPILYSIIAGIILLFISVIFAFILNKLLSNEKRIYFTNKRIKSYSRILYFIILFLIWESHLQNIMYLISFVSAGITLSLKEVILNYVAGIYIKMRKPFKVEDRIVVGNNEGDVVNINSTSFEILEISNKDDGEQSTGIIIHIPNSTIFTTPLKNYTKAFKYIWTEITVNIPIDSNIKKTKNELYKIINTNEIVKRIPKKMENEINNAITNYRIFYNKLDPIIYTKIVDNHVELSIRYLVHPKKARNVESELWNKILLLNNQNKIKLYVK